MTPVFSWLAKFAGYLQKPWIILLVITAVATIIAGLVLAMRYTRATGIVFRILGAFFLACGLTLVYVKVRVPAVKVPPTWAWIPAIGIAFIISAWYLRRRRIRAVRNQISSLVAATVERIDVLKQNHRPTDFIDLLTTNSKLVVPLLRSLVRGSRKGGCIVLTGLPGSGKTATLLNFAANCQQMRPPRGRTFVAIYVDLVEYCIARTNEDLLLAEFIQRKFHGLDVNKAWIESGRDVDWIFLFDNADEADLRWGHKEQSWQLITSFVRERSRSAPFYGLVACRTQPETVSPDYVVELHGLSNDAWKKYLIRAGIDEEVVDKLAQDKSSHWYLTDPGTLKLIVPVLARRGWATGDDVYRALTTTDNMHKVLDDAIVFRLRGFLQSKMANNQALQETATAVIKLVQDSKGFTPHATVGINQDLALVADAIRSSPQEADDNLTALAKCGLIRRFPGPDNIQFVEFLPAVATYLYTRILLERPDEIPIPELLRNSNLRLTTISLLNNADTEMVNRFVQETEQLLDWAITGLTVKTAPSDPARQQTQLYQLAYFPYTALSVLVDGLQYRLDVLGDELRAKTTEFIKHAMRIANPYIQAGLLGVSRVLGTREQAISAMKAGLTSTDATVIFRSASMVNALSEREVTELEDEPRSKLISVIILVGLRSLTLNQERENVPFGLRLADDAAVAAIVLYGIVFGLGGVFQLVNFWHHHSRNPWIYPFLQICEILVAILIAGSMVLARYNWRWRWFVLRHDFQAIMKGVSNFLAIIGGAWGAVLVLIALATFTLPLWPLLVCYMLAWPASVFFYLTSDKYPSVTNVIFPLPRVIDILWHEYRG